MCYYSIFNNNCIYRLCSSLRTNIFSQEFRDNCAIAKEDKDGQTEPKISDFIVEQLSAHYNPEQDRSIHTLEELLEDIKENEKEAEETKEVKEWNVIEEPKVTEKKEVEDKKEEIPEIVPVKVDSLFDSDGDMDDASPGEFLHEEITEE